MKIAFIIYEGMTALDFIGAYDPLTRLKTMGFMPDLEWEVCALSKSVADISGMRFTPTRSNGSLQGFDLLVVPGGLGARELLKETPQAKRFIKWLKGAADCPLKTSVCTGALLLGAAGFLQGKDATSHPSALQDLAQYGAQPLSQRVVDAGEVITAGGVSASIDLGLYLVEKLAGSQVRAKIQRQMDYIPTAAPRPATPRTASLERLTNETQIRIQLKLDGSGQHQVDTGIGFLDHMLTHIAVHGLFDLDVQARGDLHIDVHHTVEDVALALGQAFAQALGDRAGIVRMASAYTPMDEALALVAVDLSGRPYALIEADWHTPAVGNIPTTLFPHFLESFAMSARCNLHARVLTGRDDHHQAEALFKALARALDAATQIDSRRSGVIPSTKGTLTA